MQVKPLDDEERVRELARMMGRESAANLSHARELLDEARRARAQHRDSNGHAASRSDGGANGAAQALDGAMQRAESAGSTVQVLADGRSATRKKKAKA